MGNRPCPWAAEEVAALTFCAQQGLTDVQAAEAVALAYTATQRRTPHACRDKARALGLDVIWTTRSPTLIQGHKAQYGGQDENPDIKAEREDAKFVAAMAREGHTPQEPSRDPGTTCPVKIQPVRSGSVSSSAGWIAK
jgi:hypothetical protein